MRRTRCEALPHASELGRSLRKGVRKIHFREGVRRKKSNSQVAKDEKWDGVHPTCPMCSSGQAETLPHFLLHCRAYKTPRARLQACLTRELPSTNTHAPSDMELTGFLLGGRATHAEAEEALYYEVKRFLKKARRVRKPKPVTRFFNNKLCRSDPLERRGALVMRS